MISKARIKLIASLKMGKFRKEHGLFVAEGSTNVFDFYKSGLICQGIYAKSAWLEINKGEFVNTNFIEVGDKEMSKLSSLKNPSDVLAIFEIPGQNHFDVKEITDLVLVLDSIRNPGNLGTIIRTADWFGIKDIVCSNDSADAFNPKVVQASMGSLARVNIHYMDLLDLMNSKPDYVKSFGAVMDGNSILEIAKPQKGLIVIGNEAKGISNELLSLIDYKMTIPNVSGNNQQHAESLNASIATAIVCYEFRR